MKEKRKLDEVEPAEEPQVASPQQCPECGSKRLMRDYERAEIVCMDCGHVTVSYTHLTLPTTERV